MFIVKRTTNSCAIQLTLFALAAHFVWPGLQLCGAYPQRIHAPHSDAKTRLDMYLLLCRNLSNDHSDLHPKWYLSYPPRLSKAEMRYPVRDVRTGVSHRPRPLFLAKLAGHLKTCPRVPISPLCGLHYVLDNPENHVLIIWMKRWWGDFRMLHKAEWPQCAHINLSTRAWLDRSFPGPLIPDSSLIQKTDFGLDTWMRVREIKRRK